MATHPQPQGPAWANASRGDQPLAREAAAVRRGPPVIGRRRFLINRRMQTRPLLLTTGLTLILLVLLNLAVYNARAKTSEVLLASMPEMEQALRAHDRHQLVLVVSGSLVFLAGVFLVTLFETHKTAGAAFNLARHLARVRAGEYGIHLRLRKDDNLKRVGDAFNEMSLSLAERLLEDTETFERLAERASQVRGPDDLRALTQALQDEADARRKACTPRDRGARRGRPA